MKTILLSDNTIVIMYKAWILVTAKGTRKDIPRLTELAQERLLEVAA